MPAVRLDFDPARDGFSFTNRFAWTDDDLALLATRLRGVSAVPVALGAAAGGAASGGRGALAGLAAGAALGRFGWGDGIVRAVARRWPQFGLCGGMALAAVERWPAKGTPTADLAAAPMRALLRKRQERTLRASLPTFAAWWLRALRAGAQGPFADALARELDAVEARLRAGRPVVLGLVGDAPDPFALHQVVAFGIDRTGPLAATLDVYDPNTPGRALAITTGPGDRPGTTALATTLRTGPQPTGRAFVSTRPGHLAHLFVVDVDA